MVLGVPAFLDKGEGRDGLKRLSVAAYGRIIKARSRHAYIQEMSVMLCQCDIVRGESLDEMAVFVLIRF